MIQSAPAGAAPRRWLGCRSALEGIAAGLKSLVAGRGRTVSPVIVMQSTPPPVSPAARRRCVFRWALADFCHVWRGRMQRFGRAGSLSLRELPKESRR